MEMLSSSQSIREYCMEFLRCTGCSRDFEYANQLYHPITLPICGHTMCRECINTLRNETKCPQDQISFGKNNTPIDQLPTNYPLLILLYESSKLPQDNEQRYGQCPSYMKLDKATKVWFNYIETLFHDISLQIKSIINDNECQSICSRSMLRKIFTLLNSQYIDREGRLKILKTARSLGEHICIDLIAYHQDPQQLTVNLQSSLLDDDTHHELSQESIISKLSTPNSFAQAIVEFENVLKCGGDAPKYLLDLKENLKSLSQIDLGNHDQENIVNDNQKFDFDWFIIKHALGWVKNALVSLIEFIQQKTKTNLSDKNFYIHDRSYGLSSATGGNSTTSEYYLQSLHPSTSQHNQVKYKVPMSPFSRQQASPYKVHCTSASSKFEINMNHAKRLKINHSNASTSPLSLSNTNIPSSMLSLWNPQQSQNEHLVQEMPQQRLHQQHYDPSRIIRPIFPIYHHPPAMIQYHHQQHYDPSRIIRPIFPIYHHFPAMIQYHHQQHYDPSRIIRPIFPIYHHSPAMIQYHHQQYYDPSGIASSTRQVHAHSTTTTTVTPPICEHQPTNSNNNNTNSSN